MSLYGAAKRYRDYADMALDLTNNSLPSELGVDFNLARMTLLTVKKWENEWDGKGIFPWDRIFADSTRKPKHFGVALSAGGVLEGLGMVSLSKRVAHLRYVERNPTGHLGLKGKVLPAMLEVAVNFAQASGKLQLKLEPKNDTLREVYTQRYGFVDLQEGNKHFCVIDV